MDASKDSSSSMFSGGNRYKGGAEKQRAKRRKQLLQSSAGCKSLLVHFGINSGDKTPNVGATGDAASNSTSQKSGESCDRDEATADDPVPNVANSSAQDSGIGGASDKEKCNRSGDYLDWFAKPTRNDIVEFFKFHPHQPETKEFNANNVYFRTDNNLRRLWLSFSEAKNAIFCSMCLAFSTADSAIKVSQFVTGFSDLKHLYQRIEEHESSKKHQHCTEAYLRFSSKNTIDDMIPSSHLSLSRQQVIQRRLILDRVVSIVKMIGKRGTSYRGRADSEAVSTLPDESKDHGLFLECVLLVAKYDSILKNHLDDIVSKSVANTVKKGEHNRANRFTFISKTTVNAILSVIARLIKRDIGSRIQKADFYSVQIDTTQDITCIDKCSIIVRFVDEKVEERLLAVVDCHSGKGIDICNLLLHTLEDNNIDIKKCVSDTTDGASNMGGQYNGFRAHLEKASPGHIHTWCYSHVLNLVICDCTEKNHESISLFGLLHKAAVFFRESHLLMNAWCEGMEGKPGQEMKKRLSLIGATRWWSKYSFLSKIFGSFDDNSLALFGDVIQVLHKVCTSEKLNTRARFEAKGILDNMVKYSTVLTAFIYLRIMQHTSGLSKYLQTSGLDFMKAYQMVASTIKELQAIQRDFVTVKSNTDHFIDHVNKTLHDVQFHFVVEASLPDARMHRKRTMPPDECNDKRPPHALKRFEVEVHNTILDQVLQSLESRFKAHKVLYAAFACFDPRGFHCLAESSIPSSALKTICSFIPSENQSETSEVRLKHELLDFAKKWPDLRKTLIEIVKDKPGCDIFSDASHEAGSPDGEPQNCDTDYSDSDDYDHNKDNTYCKGKCRNCLHCCYCMLRRYNMFCKSYTLLFMAYKFMLTLSITQVASERCFSKLKYVKNRLRSQLGEERLDALMLMCVEKDVLANISNEVIIDELSLASQDFRRLLCLP